MAKNSPQPKKIPGQVKQHLRAHRRQTLTMAAIISILAITAGYLLLLWLINKQTYSRDILLDNSDSLVLPLLRKSLLNHEAFHWKFSSQLFIFPEALLYFVSSLFFRSVKSALLLNGLLNLLVVWLFGYLMINQLRRVNYWLNSLLAAGLVLFILALMALESSPTSLILIPYLTTTYYAGAIMAALLSLWASLYLLRHVASKNIGRRTKLVLIGLTLVVALTVLSNPLYLIWFVLPLILIVASGWLINFFSFRNVLYLTGPQLVGAAIGMAGRSLFKTYLAATLNSYFNPSRISPTITALQNQFRPLLSLTNQRVEYGLVGIITIGLFAGFIYTIKLYSGRRFQTGAAIILGQRYLLWSFGFVAPLMVIMVTIVSGNSAARYFLPLLIFPPLCLVVLTSLPRVYSWLVELRYWLLVLLVVIACSTVFTANNLVHMANYYPIDAHCLDLGVQDPPYHRGVASFWDARTLELDSHSNKVLAQVSPDFAIYPWMNNLTDYHHTDFSYVVVDNIVHSGLSIVASDAYSAAGPPSSVINCTDYTLFLYAPGSAGYKTLNQTIQKSYQTYQQTQ